MAYCSRCSEVRLISKQIKQTACPISRVVSSRMATNGEFPRCKEDNLLSGDLCRSLIISEGRLDSKS